MSTFIDDYANLAKDLSNPYLFFDDGFTYFDILAYYLVKSSNDITNLIDSDDFIHLPSLNNFKADKFTKESLPEAITLSKELVTRSKFNQLKIRSLMDKYSKFIPNPSKNILGIDFKFPTHLNHKVTTNTRIRISMAKTIAKELSHRFSKVLMILGGAIGVVGFVSGIIKVNQTLESQISQPIYNSIYTTQSYIKDDQKFEIMLAHISNHPHSQQTQVESIINSLTQISRFINDNIISKNSDIASEITRVCIPLNQMTKCHMVDF